MPPAETAETCGFPAMDRTLVRKRARKFLRAGALSGKNGRACGTTHLDTFAQSNSFSAMTTQTATQDLTETQPQRGVAVWLFLCAAWVFAVAVLGGLTRLEHAGLSIVQWKPLAGILPPLNAEQWAAEFENYKRFPEYLQVHTGLDLAGFKYIFFFEYSHRLLARFLGFAILVPLLFFWLSKRIDGRQALRYGGLVVLVGLQGALGWYMVSSGLVDRPDVSHYRLTSHLGLAVILFGLLVWFGLEALRTQHDEWGVPVAASLRFASWGAVALIYLLILSGGFVAGLDAGFDYNTFPKMDGRWLPPGLFPDNPLESIVTVQFIHRWFGVVVAAYLVLLWGISSDTRVPDEARPMYRALLIMIAVQGALGLGTLLMVVPLSLAALHQAGALGLLALAIAAAHGVTFARVRPPPGIHILPA